MKVDIEFFSCEPVDNLIACLNYKVDKIIIFGYEKDMSASICRNICQVINQKLKLKEIDFVTVNQFELKDILYKMDHVIKAELDAGNECYIDINGGRDLLLVAAGIIADKYGLYMQHIDIKSGENGCNKNAAYWYFWNVDDFTLSKLILQISFSRLGNNITLFVSNVRYSNINSII